MKGVKVRVRIGDKVLGGQRNASLNRSAEMIDTTTKDSDGWKENEPGDKEWSVACDGLYPTNLDAFNDLEQAYMAGTKVEVDLMFPSGSKYSGDAFVSEFPLNFPYTEKVDYNITFQGTGPLTINGVQQQTAGE